MSQLMKRNMRLFGLPYQFPDAVDPRIDGLSDTIGNNFLRNIVIEGPLITVIPGEPDYLPADTTKDKKVSTTAALIESASDGFATLSSAINTTKTEDLRLYDFKRAYLSYMSYVNILCRVGATFLDIDEEIDGTPFNQYDWKNYRQESATYDTLVKRAGKKIKESSTDAAASDDKTASTNPIVNVAKTVGSIFKSTAKLAKGLLFESTGTSDDNADVEEALATYNFVQFYVDPESGVSESMSNTTGESSLKSMVDTGSNYLKDLAFMLNSGGVGTEGYNAFVDSAAQGLDGITNTILGGTNAGGVLSRIINLGGNVLKGENVIIPDIYQSSEYSKSYSITVHLKSPYGTKLGYYLNVFVPMMHLLALALPREKTANSYGSPFLVKITMDGSFTCNLGIVRSISIQKMSETYNIDGLPNEVDVSLEVDDLYSDLSITPQSSPTMFVNNSSLVEFLAVNCGLSLTAPNIHKKTQMIINVLSNAIGDIPDNAVNYIQTKIDEKIASFTSLTW